MIEVISAKEARIRSANAVSTQEARETIVTAKVNSKSGIIDAIDLAIARGLFSVEIKDFDYFPHELQESLLNKGYKISENYNINGADESSSYVGIISW